MSFETALETPLNGNFGEIADWERLSVLGFLNSRKTFCELCPGPAEGAGRAQSVSEATFSP